MIYDQRGVYEVMIKLLSDSWHVEDQIRPSKGRKVHLIVDIATDERALEVPLLKDIGDQVIGLKIRGVNLGRELTFFIKKDHLVIDLGDLNSWTTTPNQDNLYKIRLDLKFTVRDPSFEISPWDLGYDSNLEVDGYLLEKGSVTLPPGLKIKDDKIGVETILKCPNEKPQSVFLNPPADYITKKGKQKHYIFVMEPEIRRIMEMDGCNSSIKISYQAVNERIYYIISIIGFALLLVAILRFYGIVTGDPNLQFDIRFLAASVGFLGLIMGLVREGYELPLRRMVFVSILFLVVDLGLEIILLK